jgi:hypothetical protein
LDQPDNQDKSAKQYIHDSGFYVFPHMGHFSILQGYPGKRVIWGKKLQKQGIFLYIFTSTWPFAIIPRDS